MTDYEENHEHHHHPRALHTEQPKPKDHSFTGLLMLLAGITTGVAVGLLFAPASGEETRRYLVDKCDDAIGKIGQRAEKLRDSGRELVEPLRQKIRPFRRDS
jgi:gas vesicle protein